MDDIAHGNNGRFHTEVGFKASNSKWSFRSHRPFYDEKAIRRD
jgi:hypothetical protein